MIKRGTCFVVVKSNEEFRFYPSRFVGYIANTRHLHSNNLEKDGRVTNKAISKINGKVPMISEALIKNIADFVKGWGLLLT